MREGTNWGAAQPIQSLGGEMVQRAKRILSGKLTDGEYKVAQVVGTAIIVIVVLISMMCRR